METRGSVARDFGTAQEVVQAVTRRVLALRERGEAVDVLTFLPDGEPTLDSRLGEEIEGLRALGVRIAVISNGSLCGRERYAQRSAGPTGSRSRSTPWTKRPGAASTGPRRPSMREDAVLALLARAGASRTLLDELLREDALRRVSNRGRTFYVRRLPRIHADEGGSA